MASFHRTVAQGAPGVGPAGAGPSEGQHVDAVFPQAPLGQMVQLLAQGRGIRSCSKVSQVLPEGSLDP